MGGATRSGMGGGEGPGAVLTALARKAIADALEIPFPAPVTGPEPWLDAVRASFVTLMEGGELRGCLGTVEAYRPLDEDVRANAVAAAFRDPRFPPLGRHEFDRIRIGVSVLSAPEPIGFNDEADAARRLRRGIDGVVFEYGRRRATFLPQVWDQLPAPETFLRALKRKAGLPDDFWAPEVRLFRYTVDKYEEGARAHREVA